MLPTRVMDLQSGILLKTFSVVLLTYVLWKTWKFLGVYLQWRKVTSQVPVVGPLHHMWGSLHLFKDLSGLYKILKDITEKDRPKVVGYWFMFLYPGFGITHPDMAKVYLKSSEPKAIRFGGAYKLLINWLGDGLLISDGKKWERNRRLLTPGFHFDILKPYVKIYNSCSDLFLENMKHAGENGKSFDIFPLVTLVTLDTVLRCAFSYQDDIQTKGENHPYVKAVGGLAHAIINRWLKPWLQFDSIYHLTNDGRENSRLCKYVHDFSENIIKERRHRLEKEGQPTKRHLDFLDILLKAKDEKGAGLSDDEIRAEVDTFLFEGHDTTASAISWAVYHFGKYPAEQEKVYQEITEIVGDSDIITWEQLQKIPKLTAFIKESMRMIAPVPGVSRLLTSPMKLGDITIPAGIQIDMYIHFIHHHPDVWPDHDVFDPERFLKEDITERHPYSFIPFAAGPRNCIGQHFAMDEIKVVLAKLIKRYKVSLVEGHVYEIKPELVTRSKNGIQITVEDRHCKTIN